MDNIDKDKIYLMKEETLYFSKIQGKWRKISDIELLTKLSVLEKEKPEEQYWKALELAEAQVLTEKEAKQVVMNPHLEIEKRGNV